MKTVVNSARFYFFPIIAANMVAMTISIGENPFRAAMYSVAISFLSSFGFLLNDLWDRDVDRANQAGHFENSDSSTITIGIIAMIVFLIAGVSLAYWIGSPEFILACCIAFSLVAYTVLLRKLLFIPTIVTAILASSPLWIPLVLWEKNFDKGKAIFIVAIIIMIAAREIFMDTRDRVGDIVGGRDTFATVFSARIAKFVGVILTVSACVPFIISILSSAYDFSTSSQLLVLGIVGIILYLLVHSAIGTVLNPQAERAAIQNYVFRSRLAMALIPVLVLLLWNR